MGETCNVYVKNINQEHISSLGYLKKVNPERGPNPQNKSVESTKIEKVNGTENNERADNTDCPFSILQKVEQNSKIQFKSLAPENFDTNNNETDTDMDIAFPRT